MLERILQGLVTIGDSLNLVKDSQKWLDKKYPTPESRAEVEKLDISDNDNISGSLSLSGFTNLIEFDVTNNMGNIIILDLTDCPKLKILRGDFGDLKLNCPNLEELIHSGNSGGNLNFLTALNPEKLRILDISNNDFPKSDLSIFSSFVNLEVLKIGSYRNRGGIYVGGRFIDLDRREVFNHFYGSLEPLKNLTKLKELNINCTDIDFGLEYLPESLEEFSYSLEGEWDSEGEKYMKRKNAKVKKIIEELEPYDGDWKKWQEDHQELMVKANPKRFLQKIQDLENKKNKKQEFEVKLSKQSQSLPSQSPNLSKQVKQLVEEIAQKEQEINDLKKQIASLNQQGKDTEELKTQLVLKEKELAELQAKNIELVKQCFFYLNVISQFREKQKELEELKKTYLGTDLTEEKWNKIGSLQTELTNLDNQLETIVQEQLTTPKNLLKNIRREGYDQVVSQLGANQPITKEQVTDKVEEQLTDALKNSLKLTNDKLLWVKNIFLDTRQRTIISLKRNYNEFCWSNRYGRQFYIDTAISSISGIGQAGTINTLSYGATEVIGKLAETGNVLWKNRTLVQLIKGFQELLKEDERNYFVLMETFSNREEPESGISTSFKEVKLFSISYKTSDLIPEVREEKKVWELSEMKDAIEKLYSNLQDLKTELEVKKSLNNQREQYQSKQQVQIQIPPK